MFTHFIPILYEFSVCEMVFFCTKFGILIHVTRTMFRWVNRMNLLVFQFFVIFVQLIDDVWWIKYLKFFITFAPKKVQFTMKCELHAVALKDRLFVIDSTENTKNHFMAEDKNSWSFCSQMKVFSVDNETRKSYLFTLPILNGRIAFRCTKANCCRMRRFLFGYERRIVCCVISCETDIEQCPSIIVELWKDQYWLNIDWQ